MGITFDSKQSKNPANIQKQESNTSIKPTYGIENKKQQDIYFGNNSFSGTDMVAIMSISNVEGVTGTYVLGSLQTLTYSTHMQRSPIRSIGNVNAKDYVMGPRTIAGSLVFAVFDRHFAYAAMEDIKGSNEGFHFLADELPPFDITITMANEYGKKAKLVIYGVRLVNEGQVMSVNDIFTENTYQFVAHDLDYLSDQNSSVGGNFVHEDLKHRPDYITDAIEVKEEDLDESQKEDADATQYITLNVKTTPSQVTPEQTFLGKASITLDRPIRNGTLTVNTAEDEITEAWCRLSADSQWPYICNLHPGDYVAFYEDEKGEQSKQAVFNIGQVTYNKKRPAPPIQIFEDKVSDGTTTVAVKIIDSVGQGIRYAQKPVGGEPTTWKEAKVQNKIAFIEGLQEFTTYAFQCTDINVFSDSLEIYVDGLLNTLFSDFYAHIKNNGHKIDDLTFLAFDKIWTETLKVRDSHRVYSVAGAIETAKQKNSDPLTSKHYVYYINEAIKFEKEINDFKNLALTLKTPVIIDEPTSLIQFHKNVKRLKIMNDTKAPKIIESHSFTQKGDKSEYRITGDAGRYTVVAVGSDGLTESGPLDVIVFSQKNIEDLLSGKVTIEELAEAQKEQLISQDGKWIDNSLTAEEKNNLTEEILNDSKNLHEGMPQPVILEMTDKYVRVRTQVASTATKKYFLCICKSSDISNTTLHKKMPISEKTDAIYLYTSKYSFIQGERYSLWIESSYNTVASRTTGFCFNLEDNPQSTIKDNYIAEELKKYIVMDFNKDQVDSYMEDGFNPIVALESILKANCQLPNSHLSKADAVLDIVRSKHRYLYGKDQKFAITKGTLTIDMKQGFIGGVKNFNDYTELHLDWYGRHGGELCNQSEVYHAEYPYTMIENRFIQDDTLALVLYFKSKASYFATEPIVIDFVSNKTYSKIKTEVIYP